MLPRHFISVTGIADELALKPLPFEVPSVHVDALWHRRSQLRGSHQWLRQAVQRATHRTQAPHRPGA